MNNIYSCEEEDDEKEEEQSNQRRKRNKGGRRLKFDCEIFRYSKKYRKWIPINPHLQELFFKNKMLYISLKLYSSIHLFSFPEEKAIKIFLLCSFLVFFITCHSHKI